MTGLGVVLLLVLLALVVGAVAIIRAVTPFIVNAVVGLVVLVLAEVLFGLEVAVTGLTLLVVAVAGVPGAVLVVLLSVFGVAF
ncbi:pro-sigmaK processing inhibitor BofA family protein [Natrialbaceae archaeon AArc-T1-2]|uniref:pro-sigmaK processing inhibitor BofA family protein n=1 Tax=Natrialbaceae archaeon AArc-T1-2 TaxID=3053904 RepID=UPI00255A9A38|nr:pro-sigmaK processing inhibitor BofA family protein [Natrialbaceae archaeon AArc-T1-2]WIV68445.1 pro-sigmaK processing inhibitor BofA family protein [Natrialbaceae archaeon AArc-T1-2]